MRISDWSSDVCSSDLCSENTELITDILRDEWGFDGLVMSDWYGTHSTAPATLAGLDLEMPGPPENRGPALRAAVDSGEVPTSVLEIGRASCRDRVCQYV